MATTITGSSIDVGSVDASTFLKDSTELTFTSIPRLRAQTGYSNNFGTSSWEKFTDWSNIPEDSHSWWDSTNQRYTPQKAGLYLVEAFSLHGYNGVASSSLHAWQVWKNGGSYGREFAVSPTGGYPNYQGIVVVPMNGTTDYIELYCRNFNSQDNCSGQLHVTYLGAQ